MKNKLSSNSAYLNILTTLLLWSSGFVAIKIGLQGYDPGSLAFFHYFLSTLIMAIPYYFLKSKRKPSLQHIVSFFLLGLIGIGFYNIALNYGEKIVDPGITSFINSQIPMTAILLAVIFFKEKIIIFGWIGMIISSIGIFCIAYGLHQHLYWDIGIIYLLAANLCAATYTLFSKVLLRYYTSIELVFYTICCGTLFLLPCAFHLYKEIQTAPFTSTYFVIYLGIFPGAIGYLTWNNALKSLKISQASACLYAMPLLATAMSWYLLHQIPTLITFTGGLIALLGSIMTTWFVMKK
ncbi:MAG: hypothetical protein A3E87_05435 [Gammaproteobacteria bacterium RIFCSPHIGHO2_12_FULL_35_23]|nr:MAG: hypothetical protein A3E87_05435 [Gammaproteobacteria bacterium RIFCSPHIGHO2_12_FULL_35_23]